ncbi:EamA family transporter [Sedimentibacter sp.]|uniref:EamA family transporter n=1 Tax=Sedimentibacter sp. TaxID=1960295 RepID=UPI00289F0EF3|nr:EamA family transporter [Sedimentibacter sp.]
MKKKDILLAALLVIMWGINFTVIKLGLKGVPSMLLIALRYLFTAFPAVFFVKKPKTELKYIVLFGLFVGVGQFACLFYAMEIGMPASIASIVLQIQAFISPVMAVFYLNEKIKTKQIIGFVIAAAGLLIIGAANARDGINAIPVLAIILNLLAPVFWSASNIVARIASDKEEAKGEKLDMLSLVVWSSLVPVIPLTALAFVFDTPQYIFYVITNFSGISIFSVLYLAVGATLFGYGVWGKLIGEYPMGKVAPIPLLVPVIALISARIVLDEQLSGMQWIGVVIILIGLVTSNLDFGMFKKHLGRKALENEKL